MELNEIFLLYSNSLPLTCEIKDTGHGEMDFRQAIFAKWQDQKLVIKIAGNDFTTPHRVQCWHDTAKAYRSFGFYCPAFIKNRNGHYAEEIEYSSQKCVVFAEEFSVYKTAEQYAEKDYKPGGRYVYHDDIIRFIGTIGLKRLQTADFPSGICVLEKFAPSDPCDEVMETALDFKKMIEERFPQYHDRFQQIWDSFMRNKEKLAKVYSKLPTSVFQADLNHTNVLLDSDLRFAGLLDFNLCGYDSVLNCLFRESFTNFKDVPYDNENNMFYSEERNEKALRSFYDNIRIIKETYAFSQLERETAILLYRYLRPFWWQPFHALSQDTTDAERAAKILTWIEREQQREIDFDALMA